MPCSPSREIVPRASLATVVRRDWLLPRAWVHAGRSPPVHQLENRPQRGDKHVPSSHGGVSALEGVGNHPSLLHEGVRGIYRTGPVPQRSASPKKLVLGSVKAILTSCLAALGTPCRCGRRAGPVGCALGAGVTLRASDGLYWGLGEDSSYTVQSPRKLDHFQVVHQAYAPHLSPLYYKSDWQRHLSS